MNLGIYKRSFFCKNYSLRRSKYIFIPIPLEKTVTYKKGTNKAPDFILDASYQIDYFNEITNTLINKLPCSVLNPLDCSKTHLEVIENIFNLVKYLYSKNKFVISLGGEHSLTLGVIKGVITNFDELTIIQIDAHSDMRKTYMNSKLNHACVMYNIMNLSNNINLIQIGIRSLSGEDVKNIRKFRDRIYTFWDYFDIYKKGFDFVLEQVKTLIKNKNVYLTIDVDGFNFIYSSTGTPEPGGISYYQTIELFKVIIQNSNLIGADFVELSPIEGFHAPVFYVAKLIFNLIVLKEKKDE